MRGEGKRSCQGSPFTYGPWLMAIIELTLIALIACAMLSGWGG